MSVDGEEPEAGEPSDESGLVVPLREVVARGRDVAVVITHARVFSTGLLVEAEIFSRAGAPAVPWLDTSGSSEPDGLLQVGFAYDEPAEMHPAHRFVDDGRPIWRVFRSGGGDGRFDVTWWVAPYPQNGRLVMAVQWLQAGLARTSARLTLPAPTDVDAARLRVWPVE